MPQTRFQRIVFGVFMSYAMAVGMEVYNVAIKMGLPYAAGGMSNMTNAVFPAALKEAAYMGALVFLFSSLWGNRLGSRLAARRVSPERDSPYLCRLTRQACTVGVMCPTMSLAASILFNILLAGGDWAQFPAIWAGTLIKNFPMALLWNLYAAAPLARLLFRALFGRQPAARRA